MNSFIKSILLVDDDEAIIFANKLLVARINPNTSISVSINGQLAIDYLNHLSNEGLAPPSIILLDLNMPVLDGWGFLEKYKLLPSKFKEETVLIIASSSPNPDDKKRAKENPDIKDYLLKPIDFGLLFKNYQRYATTHFIKTA